MRADWICYDFLWSRFEGIWNARNVMEYSDPFFLFYAHLVQLACLSVEVKWQLFYDQSCLKVCAIQRYPPTEQMEVTFVLLLSAKNVHSHVVPWTFFSFWHTKSPKNITEYWNKIEGESWAIKIVKESLLWRASSICLEELWEVVKYTSDCVDGCLTGLKPVAL